MPIGKAACPLLYYLFTAVARTRARVKQRDREASYLLLQHSQLLMRSTPNQAISGRKREDTAVYMIVPGAGWPLVGGSVEGISLWAWPARVVAETKAHLQVTGRSYLRRESENEALPACPSSLPFLPFQRFYICGFGGKYLRAMDPACFTSLCLFC